MQSPSRLYPAVAAVTALPNRSRRRACSRRRSSVKAAVAAPLQPSVDCLPPPAERLPTAAGGIYPTRLCGSFGSFWQWPAATAAASARDSSAPAAS
ncbi:unnamed protein product [Closterium sp. NIES-64]|nr:unnamed protein product [Closterium sp. NIES-64]